MDPRQCLTRTFAVEGTLEDCEVTVSAEGLQLVSYRVYTPDLRPIPEPAQALPRPEQLKSLEELWLAATHLEQYRHATVDPAIYYQEGLRRDATDIRLNTGYGLLLYRRGQIRESIPYFEQAVAKQIWRNPNPYYGESYFDLGLALDADGQTEQAYDAFYKATWSAETQGAAFYRLACLECRRGEYRQALAFAEQALLRGWHDMKTRVLKAALLRLLGQENAAFLNESLAIDPLCMGCLYEKALHDDTLGDWRSAMRAEAHNYLTLALDYAQAGLFADGIRILTGCPATDPMPYYYLGWLYAQAGQNEQSVNSYGKAEKLTAIACFPSRLEEMAILRSAIAALKSAPQALLLLGCLLYDKKQYEAAIQQWEQAVQENPELAMAHRNLAIAYYNKRGDQAALAAMQKALTLDAQYPRYLLEYDQLSARLGHTNAQRLALLEQKLPVTQERDDLYLRYITLLNCAGRYEEALRAVTSRRFHPWEGGEGRASGQYRYALFHMAQKNLTEHEPDKALALLQQSLEYPENLGEGKLPNVPDHQAYYLMGLAWRQKQQEEQAHDAFAQAAAGDSEPSDVRYYNDQPSDYIYFQGLARRALGDEAGARKAFHTLIGYGERHMFDEVGYDFFAVSLPEIEVFADDIVLRHTQYCRYLRALGHLGLEDTEKAAMLARELLTAQPDHQGALDILGALQA